MPTKKAYKERQYSLSNAEMLELVTRMQDGDDAAALRMIEVFENFLTNFIKLLFYGIYDRNKYEVRRFIGFYIPNAQLRYKFMRNQLNAKDIREVNDVVRGIYLMCQRYCDYEDVEQAIRMAFLSALMIYEPRPSAQGGSVPIANYISNYSLYLFKKATDTFLIDQLGRKTFPLIEESDLEEDENTPGFMAPPGPALEAYLDREEFDDAWVQGATAKGVWGILEPSERQLLKWRYIDGEKASVIAARILTHPNTLRESLSKTKQKITDYLAQESID